LRLAPLPGFDRHLQPPIAADVVRYAGEPVALVVAEDRYVAADAASLVRVEYDALPAIVDARLARGDDVSVASAYSVSRGYPDDFLVPAAARTIGRPLKWIESRRESFLATNHSREIECELEIAARRDGTILGVRARLLADMGAYVRTNGGVVPAKAAQFLPG